MENEYKIANYLRVISIVMLFLALGPFPYFYYQLLRWVIAGTFFYLAWLNYNEKETGRVWTYIIAGVIFNPLVPFSLSKSIWQFLDIVAGFLLIISLFITKRR